MDSDAVSAADPSAAPDSTSARDAKPLPEGWNSDELIHELYLRTLSRMPRPEELETARTFISESSDPIDGFAGRSVGSGQHERVHCEPLIAVHFRRHAATENGREMSEMIELSLD